MSYHWPGAFIFTSQDYCRQKPVYYIFTYVYIYPLYMPICIIFLYILAG